MLKGKTAVITGASRGIGRAIALEMAKHDAKIAAIYAGNDDAAIETKKMILDEGGECEIYKCDVADFEKVKLTIETIKNTFDSIDILVNNAGIVKDMLVLAMKEEDFDNVLATNLKGTFNMIKHTYKIFMKQKSGTIINISSVVGITGNSGQANYAAAKAGIIGLTKSVAKELAGRGVTCNSIAPGFISTDMTVTLSDAVKDSILKSIPMKSFGTAEDIAKTAVFLASDNARYITGEVIRVDGGMCM